MLQSILDYVRRSFRDAALAGVADAVDVLQGDGAIEPLDGEAKLRGRVLALAAASTDTDADIDIDAPAVAAKTKRR